MASGEQWLRGRTGRGTNAGERSGVCMLAVRYGEVGLAGSTSRLPKATVGGSSRAAEEVPGYYLAPTR